MLTTQSSHSFGCYAVFCFNFELEKPVAYTHTKMEINKMLKKELTNKYYKYAPSPQKALRIRYTRETVFSRGIVFWILADVPQIHMPFSKQRYCWLNRTSLLILCESPFTGHFVAPDVNPMKAFWFTWYIVQSTSFESDRSGITYRLCILISKASFCRLENGESNVCVWWLLWAWTLINWTSTR